MQILPIGSGKGGVGKSVIAANLSIALAQAGKRVVLADLDLGGSNLHTILGFRSVRHGIGSFLCDRRMKFADIVLDTEYRGMSFIPGDTEIPGMANLTDAQRRRLLRNLVSLDTEYLIIDLGAGSGTTAIDCFLLSGKGVIVTTPSLVAVLNAYLFLKNAVFRLLYSALAKGSPALSYLRKLRTTGSQLQRVYVPRLLENVKVEDPDGYGAFVDRASRLQPRLVLNMVEDPKDVVKVEKLRRSTEEYLSVSLEHLGVVYRDAFQDVALNSRIPIVRYKPESALSQAVYRITEKILQSPGEEVPMDVETIQESFELAELEAENDFQSKFNDLEELLHCGALTTGDLIETLRAQQFEVQQLKKENQLLRGKLATAVEAGFRI